jgi:hypothetical protein
MKSIEGRRINERLQIEYLALLILLTLSVNCILCVLGKADTHVFSERLGAVFYGACGALITALTRQRPR